MEQLTLSGIIAKSWNTYKNNFNAFLQPIVISILTSIAVLIPTSFDFPYNLPLMVILIIVSIAVSIWLNVVFLQLSNDALKRKPIELQKIYNDSWKRSPRFLWLSLLYGLIVLGGTILLIIPGIFFAVRYIFSELEIAISEQMPTATQALQNSKNITLGRWWDVVVMAILPIMFFTLIGFLISFGLGGVVTAGHVSYETLSENFYFNILFTTVTNMITPLTILPLVIVYNELKK